MARKIKFIYKYKSKYLLRDSKIIFFFFVMSIVLKDWSLAKLLTSWVFLTFIGIYLARYFAERESKPSEFKVYNTGFEFPNVGLVKDSEEYANFKDVKKIELVDDYLTIKMKSGKFFEIPLSRISYVGRLSFAEELMQYKKHYDEYRKRRRTVNRRKRQAKRLERQKQQAA